MCGSTVPSTEGVFSPNGRASKEQKVSQGQAKIKKTYWIKILDLREDSKVTKVRFNDSVFCFFPSIFIYLSDTFKFAKFSRRGCNWDIPSGKAKRFW